MLLVVVVQLASANLVVVETLFGDMMQSNEAEFAKLKYLPGMQVGRPDTTPHTHRQIGVGA